MDQLITEAVFKEKRGVWYMGPYAGADYNFTLSHCRLRITAFTPNDDECLRIFPQMLKNGITNIGKGRVRERGREGAGELT